MSSLRRMASGLAAWIQSCGLAFLGIGMALAFGAAAAKFLGDSFSGRTTVFVWLGGIAYLACAAAGWAGLRQVRNRAGNRAFLWTAATVSLLIQLAAIFASDRRWVWTADARIFGQYLDRLAETGYSPETLAELSRNYDYPVWTRRALPFYFLLRQWTGGHFVRAVQLFQAALVSVSLLLTWRIARLLFGERVAFGATTLQVLMPFRWFSCLVLNHYLPGGFYFAAALWVLAEWSQPARRVPAWLLALIAGWLLPLMRLEGGIDQIYLLAAAGVLLLRWADGSQTARQTAQAALAWLGVPLLACSLLLPPLSVRLDQANRHRLSSGTVAFLARGWMPETGGEYSATYEQIDWLTPPARKAAMQASILASQAYYNPAALLFRLLPAKSAKYFLLGYASGAEEMLVRNGAARAVDLAKGARIAYWLAVAPLMLWGLFTLLPVARKTTALCLILPGTLFCAATALVGESSPRYSIYVQPFLFMLGALPLAMGCRRRRFRLRAARLPGLAAGATWLALLGVAAAALYGARPWLRVHAVEDLRRWTPLPETQTRTLPATQAPFEIHLLPRADESQTRWGALQLPPMPAGRGTLSFYALPDGATFDAWRGVPLVTEYATADGWRVQTNSLLGPVQLEDLPAAATVAFRAPVAFPFPLRIGYATYAAGPAGH